MKKKLEKNKFNVNFKKKMKNISKVQNMIIVMEILILKLEKLKMILKYKIKKILSNLKTT